MPENKNNQNEKHKKLTDCQNAIRDSRNLHQRWLDNFNPDFFWSTLQHHARSKTAEQAVIDKCYKEMTTEEQKSTFKKEYKNR